MKDHSFVLARYTDLHRIHGNDTVHSSDLAKLPQHPKQSSCIGRHHYTGADFPFRLLEHTISDLVDAVRILPASWFDVTGRSLILARPHKIQWFFYFKSVVVITASVGTVIAMTM